MPPAARRIIHTNSSTISSAGPKLNSNVTNTDVPVDGEVALITTPLDCSSASSALLLANSGSSVTNSLAGVAVLFAGYRTAVRKLPCTVVPFDEIELTLPALTCARNVGLYGIRTRAGCVCSVEVSTMLNSSSSRKKIRKPGPNNRGLGGGGAPRPSGPGRTRQPLGCRSPRASWPSGGRSRALSDPDSGITTHASAHRPPT